MNDDIGAGVPTTHDGGESTVSALEALLKQPEGEAGKAAAMSPNKGGSTAEETPEESPEPNDAGEGDGPDEDQVTEEEEDGGEGDPEAVIAPPKS